MASIVHQAQKVTSTDLPSLRQYGLLTIDFDREAVYLDGRRLHLTPTELRLLLALLARPEALHRYEDLQHRVWGSAEPDDRVQLHSYICRLRRKLSIRGWNPILTEQGRGYRLNAPLV